MTKENKLALVVGFALILFVGILISDHFSTARTQQSADLLPADDPLVDQTQNPHLLDFTVASNSRAGGTGGAARPELLMNPQRISDPVQQATPAPIQVPDIQRIQGTHQSGGRVSLPREEASSLPYHFHDVAAGQSLTSICRRFYGDTSLVRELAAYNGLADPDRLTAGMRLRIPQSTTLVRGDASPPSPAPRVAAPPPRKQRRDYRVQPGDVLGVIAKKTLGSSRRWRELYDLNRDVIRDPDLVQAGIVLKLPD